MLFDRYTLRGATFRNRITVSPMCQYSGDDGLANDWHFVHLGSRAVGGAGLILVEATAVEPRGRISPADLGLWKEEQIGPLARITSFLRSQGAVPGIQLAHAGRKASTHVPWEGRGAVPERDGGWQVIAPSAVPFAEQYPVPREMTGDDIGEAIEAFARAAARANDAGFETAEIHAAHGYLIHQFLSPLSNRRTDSYGGSFENRVRFALETVRAVRSVWPERLPLFVRISATDWVAGGWDLEQSVELARLLKPEGVDLIDCSSGGTIPHAKIPLGPGYQTRFSERIRTEAGIPTSAVGIITSPQQAEHILLTGQADLIMLARQLLRDPYWPLRAASELQAETAWPNQYLRARF